MVFDQVLVQLTLQSNRLCNGLVMCNPNFANIWNVLTH